MNKLAILFPGQGTQYVGMGKKLCETYQIARDTFEEASDVSAMDLKKICFYGPLETLTRTEITQPVILTASVASYRVAMKEYNLQPSFLAGHSLGEITALCCAGGISFPDAVRIVIARGRFMQEAVPEGKGSMSAIIGIAVEEIEKLCCKYNNEHKVITIANYNSPNQIVVTGYAEAVIALGEEAKGKGALVTPLKVSAPFHSWLMQPAADMLKEELCKYKYSPLQYPVLSNYLADTYSNEECIVDHLTAQLVNPVRWTEIMQFLNDREVDTIIDTGPKTVIKNLAKKNIENINAYSLDVSADTGKLYEEYHKCSEHDVEDSNVYNRIVEKCIAIAVCTKNQNWDEDDYYNNMIIPYRKIVAMKNELDEKNIVASRGQAEMALHMLETVFKTKKTPVEEQKARIRQLFDETKSNKIFSDFTFLISQ